MITHLLMINKKSNSFIMITHLFIMNNDIYKLFHLDNSSQKQVCYWVTREISHFSRYTTMLLYFTTIYVSNTCTIFHVLYRSNSNHKCLVDLFYLLSAKYMKHIHTITFKIIKKLINYIGHEKRRTTWSRVEMLLRWITISNNLSNINGRLKMT